MALIELLLLLPFGVHSYISESWAMLTSDRPSSPKCVDIPRNLTLCYGIQVSYWTCVLPFSFCTPCKDQTLPNHAESNHPHCYAEKSSLDPWKCEKRLIAKSFPNFHAHWCTASVPQHCSTQRCACPIYSSMRRLTRLSNKLLHGFPYTDWTAIRTHRFYAFKWLIAMDRIY